MASLQRIQEVETRLNQVSKLEESDFLDGINVLMASSRTTPDSKAYLGKLKEALSEASDSVEKVCHIAGEVLNLCQVNLNVDPVPGNTTPYSTPGKSSSDSAALITNHATINVILSEIGVQLLTLPSELTHGVEAIKGQESRHQKFTCEYACHAKQYSEIREVAKEAMGLLHGFFKAKHQAYQNKQTKMEPKRLCFAEVDPMRQVVQTLDGARDLVQIALSEDANADGLQRFADALKDAGFEDLKKEDFKSALELKNTEAPQLSQVVECIHIAHLKRHFEQVKISSKLNLDRVITSCVKLCIRHLDPDVIQKAFSENPRCTDDCVRSLAKKQMQKTLQAFPNQQEFLQLAFGSDYDAEKLDELAEVFIQNAIDQETFYFTHTALETALVSAKALSVRKQRAAKKRRLANEKLDLHKSLVRTSSPKGQKALTASMTTRRSRRQAQKRRRDSMGITSVVDDILSGNV